MEDMEEAMVATEVMEVMEGMEVMVGMEVTEDMEVMEVIMDVDDLYILTTLSKIGD
jgi:hypothetical protein